MTDELDLCSWHFPNKPGLPCVRERGHDGHHYIYRTGGRKTLVVMEVVYEDRLREVLHAQVKLPLTREDVAAFVALMEVARTHLRDPDEHPLNERTAEQVEQKRAHDEAIRRVIGDDDA